MPTPGPLELVIILVIALLILGPGRLPDVGSALGKSIREFRKASSDIQESVKVDTSPIPATPPTAMPAAAPVAAAPVAAPIVAAAAATAEATPIAEAPAQVAEAAPAMPADLQDAAAVATASTSVPSSGPTPGTN